MILATFAWAYTIVVVRELRMKDHYEGTLYFGIILSLIGGVGYCFNGSTIFNENPKIYILAILYHGIPLAVAQLFYM